MVILGSEEVWISIGSKIMIQMKKNHKKHYTDWIFFGEENLNISFHSWLVENTKLLRAEICQKFRWLFWRFEDTKNSEINWSLMERNQLIFL